MYKRQGLDLAITGEGFFQVQDAFGNTFYTRAGVLYVDPSSNNLVDSNGYTVLEMCIRDRIKLVE